MMVFSALLILLVAFLAVVRALALKKARTAQEFANASESFFHHAGTVVAAQDLPSDDISDLLRTAGSLLGSPREMRRFAGLTISQNGKTNDRAAEAAAIVASLPEAQRNHFLHAMAAFLTAAANVSLWYHFRLLWLVARRARANRDSTYTAIEAAISTTGVSRWRMQASA